LRVCATKPSWALFKIAGLDLKRLVPRLDGRKLLEGRLAFRIFDLIESDPEIIAGEVLAEVLA